MGWGGGEAIAKGGFGTRPWWLALFACGGAYWPLAFETSAMTIARGGGVAGGGGGCVLRTHRSHGQTKYTSCSP